MGGFWNFVIFRRKEFEAFLTKGAGSGVMNVSWIKFQRRVPRQQGVEGAALSQLYLVKALVPKTHARNTHGIIVTAYPRRVLLAFLVTLRS